MHHRDAHIESGEKNETNESSTYRRRNRLICSSKRIKRIPIDITAIVTVADNGGSTGKIRDVMDIPAPGDIRNVIAALSDSESTLTQLFQYRFDENKVDGHSLGIWLLQG